jgi:type I site-specific restriction endonuclease
MKTKEVLDSIEQLKNKFTEKLNKLNEMPKKQQHWLDGHWSGHVNAYNQVLSLIDVRFEMWQEEQKVTALCNELKEVKEHNEELKNKLKKRAKQFNDSTDRLKETIRSVHKNMEVIRLEKDRTEDKYNTLHKLLLDATKIGLNK